jgi:hypothetical protein
MSISQEWLRLLVEWEAAKHYYMRYALIIGWTFRNPLVEHMLPALLHVKLLTILDEALASHIEARSLTVPKKYRNSLEGRISFLFDSGDLLDGTALHAARERRNAVAHEISEYIDWDTLASDVAEVERALQHLGVVGARPQIEYFSERSGLESSQERGVLGVRQFRIGVKSDGEPIYEASWDQKLHSIGSK